VTIADDTAGQKAGANQSVMRAVRLLRCFIDESSGITLSELARRTGINVSTAHRILGTLQEGGLVARAEGDKYRPGIALLALAGATFASSGLEAATEIVREVADRTGESVALSVRDIDCAVVLVEAESAQPLRFSFGAGTRQSLHQSAAGLVLLAFSENPEREVAALARPLIAAHTNSFVDPVQLVAELRNVRSAGVAVVTEHGASGVTSISVPVPRNTGAPTHTVGLAAPSSRLSPAQIAAAKLRLTETAGLLAALPLWGPPV
jgi:IclR family acetate operon transcriptional repressor